MNNCLNEMVQYVLLCMHECLIPGVPKDVVHPTPASGTGMEIPDYHLQCSLLYKLLSLSAGREEMECKGVAHAGVERKGRLRPSPVNPRI